MVLTGHVMQLLFFTRRALISKLIQNYSLWNYIDFLIWFRLVLVILENVRQKSQVSKCKYNINSLSLIIGQFTETKEDMHASESYFNLI